MAQGQPDRQPSDAVEDLQPKEDESTEVKNGSFSFGHASGGGGGAGRTGTVERPDGAARGTGLTKWRG
jgi:hypothetical protein